MNETNSECCHMLNNSPLKHVSYILDMIQVRESCCPGKYVSFLTTCWQTSSWIMWKFSEIGSEKKTNDKLKTDIKILLSCWEVIWKIKVHYVTKHSSFRLHSCTISVCVNLVDMSQTFHIFKSILDKIIAPSFSIDFW